MRYQQISPPSSWLGRIIAGLLGIVIVIVSVFVGAIALAFIFGAGVLGVTGLRIRQWWLGRKAPGQSPGQAQGQPPGGSTRSGQIIEAEYEVVSKERDAES